MFRAVAHETVPQHKRLKDVFGLLLFQLPEIIGSTFHMSSEEPAPPVKELVIPAVIFQNQSPTMFLF